MRNKHCPFQIIMERRSFVHNWVMTPCKRRNTDNVHPKYQARSRARTALCNHRMIQGMEFIRLHTSSVRIIILNHELSYTFQPFVS